MGGRDDLKSGIPEHLLDRVFPFRIVADADLRVLQVGSSMARIAPGLRVGTRLDEHFLLRRPQGEFSGEGIASAQDQPFLLKFIESDVRLRGQFLALPDGRWMFLGSPWFDTAEEIEKAGLSLIDYPVHDPMAELLMIGQTQRMALHDLRDLTARLERQREAVRRTERIYRDAIAAADAVAYQTAADDEQFEFINSGIYRLTGYTTEEITPALLRSLVLESSPTPHGVGEAGARSRRTEHRIRTKEGGERWLLESSIRVLDADSTLARTVGILEDITERKRQEVERERLRVELDTVLRLSPQGFAAFDASGRLSFCNPAFEDMTGHSSESLAGMTLDALDGLFADLSHGGHTPAPMRSLGEESADVLELGRPERRTVTRSVRRMQSVNHELHGWVVFMRDITREREIDRMKSEFLSTAAHELRTPMTSVQGFAELLLSDDFDPAMTRDIAETIHRQASLLVHIVNELLDIARIESGQGKDFVYEPLAVHELVRETVAALRIPDDEREVRLLLEHDGSPMILADGKKTMLAVTNVLSNAYKYSPRGGDITLSVSRRAGTDRGEIAITVTDQGVGMDETELARLFERFYRADPSGAIPGTGLGMSLVKEIVELQAGRVEVESRKGEGTRVTILLPEFAVATGCDGARAAGGG